MAFIYVPDDRLMCDIIARMQDEQLVAIKQRLEEDEIEQIERAAPLEPGEAPQHYAGRFERFDAPLEPRRAATASCGESGSRNWPNSHAIAARSRSARGDSDLLQAR